MLTLASFLWFDPDYRHNDKYTYGVGDVKLWRDMVHRNLTIPHEFVCITDQPELFDGTNIRPVPIDDRLKYPNRIFQQLMAFHPDARELFGPRLCTMDLDVVVTGNLDDIVSRPEPLVLWRNPARVPYHGKGIPRSWYNTSIMLIETGQREIWDTFINHTAKVMASFRAGQEYISGTVGPDCPYWDGSHGIYRPRRPETPGSGLEPGAPLPDNCRLVFFPGEQTKPWIPEQQEKFPWIKQYRF